MEISKDLWEVLDSQHQARIAEIIAERDRHLSNIPDQAMLWLALAPFWTVSLAEACDFPGGELGVRELFTHLYKEGLCEYIPIVSLIDEDEFDVALQRSKGANDCFNLIDTVRSEVLQRVIRDPEQGRERLISELQIVGKNVLQASELGVPVPPLIERWATLASANDMIRRFRDQATRKLLQDNLNGLQSWIEAARWLESIGGTDLLREIERAARRLELRHRRSYDMQFLERFLRRDDQIKAFTELLHGSNDHWALHYVGEGGVGKTMLMRYLTTRYFAGRTHQASICRIDFDYLNPDYPSRSPGLLLDQISQELRLYGGDRADKEFAHFDDLVRDLHELLGSASAGNFTTGRALADKDFDYLIRTFIRAISSLPQPVVLILDTCEELAKIRPNGTIPENVRATFAILERIHDALPHLRVVFSGRRPLASAGYGWECPSSPHPERPYLRLHEICGFTYDEARHYLLKQAEVRGELVEPIIQKSLDKGSIYLFRWRDKHSSGTKLKRYNPFDLALYAGWVREDTSITADDILTPGVDRYIEGRIMGRIHHPRVLTLLPAVALLGTFDSETLRVVAHSDERTFSTIFQELANQEWLQLQQFTFWRVKSGLRERLYSYYREHNPQALAEARKLLLPYLESITLEWPLSSLNVSHFDAALRLLEEDDPRRAAAWWARIEARFASEGNAYGWALTLIEQLLGGEGAVADVNNSAAKDGRKESALRPAVLATYASAQLHTRPSASRESTWDEVLLKRRRHPLPEGTNRLRMRARAGKVTTHFSRGDLKAFYNSLNNLHVADLDEQLAASFVAALEAAVEYAEKTRIDLSWKAALRLMTQLEKAQISRELQVFALTLAGRIYIMIKEWETAHSQFMRALSLLPELSLGQQRWLDWLAPEDLSARVRLEFVRALYPAILSPIDVLKQIGNELTREPLKTNDEDRLGSAILLLRGATGDLPSIDHVSHLATSYANYTLPTALPLSNAHHAFQPFTMALAEILAALGELRRALEILERYSLQAEQSSVDLDTVHAADRAKLRIVRRWRLRDEGYGFSSSLMKSSLLADQELLWSLAGLDGPKSPDPDWTVLPEGEILLWLHARWRTSYTLRSDRLQAAVKGFSSALPSPANAEASFAFFSYVLDLLEVRQMTNSEVMLLIRGVANHDILNLVNDALGWVLKHPETPLEAIRLLLRIQALREQNVLNKRSRAFNSLIERMGKDQAAAIALEEAEMLVLRLPAHALSLFFLSRTLFKETNDRVGEIIAGTCAALTLARLGRRSELISLLDSIIASYIRYFRVQVADGMLEKIADHVDLDELTFVWPEEWRPWLIRLIACMIWAREDARKAERMTTLCKWLESHYGARLIGGETVLPAEFDGWLVAKEQTREPLEIKSTLPSADALFSDRFVLDVKARSQGRDDIYAQINLSHVMQGKEVEWYTTKLLEFSLLQPYKEVALRYEDLLPSLKGRAISDATIIELHTDEYSSALCWEGLISLWLEAVSARSTLSNLPRFHCYRTVRERQVRAYMHWSDVSEVLSIIPHFKLESLIVPIWHEIPNERLRFSSVLSRDIVNFKFGGSSANVLHLVANAREANGSLFLDISASSPTEKASVVNKSRGRLLRSEELSKIFPKLTICLLQSLPAQLTGRTETDRENAAYQRRFAAELHEQGVPIVLTIPPLPEKTVPHALRPFLTALVWNDRPSIAVLLNALSEARRLIAQDMQVAGGSREEILETALDLCLYFAPQQEL